MVYLDPWETMTTGGVPSMGTTLTTGHQLVVVKPAVCTANVHVWACEHAAWCKCRTAWRDVGDRVGCPVCGQ